MSAPAVSGGALSRTPADKSGTPVSEGIGRLIDVVVRGEDNINRKVMAVHSAGSECRARFPPWLVFTLPNMDLGPQ
jgi:hypothetical protein